MSGRIDGCINNKDIRGVKICIWMMVALSLLVTAGCGGERVPRCKECALPMDKPELFGTQADGSRSPDYCIHCLKQGEIVERDPVLERMFEKEDQHYLQLQDAADKEK
jgi:hypothetical protein